MVENDGVDLDALLKKDLLWAKAENADDGPEDALLAAMSLITAVVREVAMGKKGYVELFRNFATEIQSARRESEIAARNLTDLVP